MGGFVRVCKGLCGSGRVWEGLGESGRVCVIKEIYSRSFHSDHFSGTACKCIFA